MVVKLPDRLAAQLCSDRFSFVIILIVLVSSIACKQQQPPIVATPPPAATPQIPTAISQPSPIYGKPWRGRGVVKLINRPEGWIEIDHEEIVGLMPPMEMEWFVEKKSLLNRAKVGDKVDFVIMDTRDRGQILTDIKRIE